MAATQGSDHGPQVPPQVPGYRVGEPLGSGGSGTVWAATREADGQRCAVKVVPVRGSDETSSAARELAVLGRVAVEGLVGFHEAVVLGDDAAEAVALVLDHVGGGSLDRVVRARGRLSVGESVTVLAPVARTLAGLHALGVAHGDVSPANVLLELSGRPLLGDLGVARLAGELPGEVHGTDGFVAPEVLDGAAAGAAADVYALGAVAWYCVTGSPPGPAALRPPLESLVPSLPPAWLEATARALRGEPARRPTAAELALAYFDAAACEPLRLVVGSDETSMLTHRLRDAPAPATAAVTPPRRLSRLRGLPRPPRLRRPSPRTGRALATVGALVALLGTGGLLASGTVPAPSWLTAHHRDRTPQAPTTGPGRGVEAAGPVAGQAVTPLQEPQAPRARALGLMQALADLRAHAMESGSRSALADLDAPGSPALAADAAELARLRRSGQAYEGVRLVVRHATATKVSARSATVEAVVDTAAYVVVTRGRTRAGPAVTGERLRFALVWVDGRWLVSRVDSVSGTGATGP